MRSPEGEQWLSLDSGIWGDFFFFRLSSFFVLLGFLFKHINLNHLNQKEN